MYNNNKGDMLCAWSGIATVIVFMVAWVLLADWMPPPEPGLNANEIVEVYQNNLFGIRTGMVLMMLCGMLNVAFAAVIMVYMLRMKGPSPALAYTQFGSGAVNVLFFILPAQIWTATAFRPDRAIEITQFGNDLGWLVFDMVTSPTVLQWLALGLAIILDKSPKPVFPRWFGYYNFWAAMLVLPTSFITYFKVGPFAWNGILGFYVSAVSFCAWYFITFFMLRKAIKEHKSTAIYQ